MILMMTYVQFSEDDEKIMFIMANVFDSGFLERVNTLLTNGEVIEEIRRGRRKR